MNDEVCIIFPRIRPFDGVLSQYHVIFERENSGGFIHMQINALQTNYYFFANSFAAVARWREGLAYRSHLLYSRRDPCRINRGCADGGILDGAEHQAVCWDHANRRHLFLSGKRKHEAKDGKKNSRSIYSSSSLHLKKCVKLWVI